jgi:protein AIR1/2
MEEGEVTGEQQGTAKSQSPASGDSDESDSLDSEADDSIMLNIGSRAQSRSQNDVITISDDDSSDADAYDPESLSVSRTPATVDIFDTQNGVANGSATDSKENALLRFAQKYPAAPSILADLDREDMEILAKIVFYDRDISDINLQLPIICIECLREGHLVDVCPMKEVGSVNLQLSRIPPINEHSVSTATHGTNTRAASAHSGDDARDVANAATTKNSVPLP